MEEDEEGAESTGRTASSSIEGQVPVSVLFVVLQHNSTLEDYLQREKKKRIRSYVFLNNNNGSNNNSNNNNNNNNNDNLIF